MTHVTIDELKAMKRRGEKIAMLTAYDYPTARILDEAGVPIILVGDSLGMVVLGYDSTLPVTMEDMIHHTRAVVRGTERTHVVFDMPFMSYQSGVEDALRNAGRALQETGAQSVKLEGGAHMAETVRRLVEVGIPVMGHIGLTPQSVNQLSGFRVQGKTPAAAVAPPPRRPRAGAGRRLRYRPGDHPGAPGPDHHLQGVGADDRHRRRARLRRPGAGDLRLPGPLPRLRAQALPSVRPPGG